MHLQQPAAKLAAFAGVAVLMLLLWLLLRQLGMPASLSASAISTWLNDHGLVGPLLLIAMMIMAVVIGPIPTLPISAASGLAFGVVGGTLVAAAGALIGALVAFWTARFVAREVVCRHIGDNPLFSGEQTQPALFWIVFMTRLVPLFSFALISYAAGLTAITAWRFALASFLGMLPMTVVFAGLGHTLEFHPVLSVVAGVFVVGLMVFAPYWFTRRHRRHIARRNY